jgi:hypothetical protein
MNMSDTHSLLAEYARNGSEKAFREIVDRYIDLVYSTALRMVDGDSALSELRTCAEAKISGDLVEALAAYIKQNGHFPATVPDLEPFLKRPINLAILQRWMVASPKDFKAGRLGGDLIVTQSSTPDPEYDKRLLIGPNGCYPITPFSVEK